MAEVSASTGESGTVSTIKITSDDLTTVTAALAAPGAPVYVTIELVDSGPLAGLDDAVTDMLAKIGLK